MGVRKMQGVPAHLEVLVCKDKKRRHMMRCKFIIKSDKACDCSSSNYFQKRCGGSSHCDYYAER